MRRAFLLYAFLFSLVFCFATWLEPWFQGWAGNRTRSTHWLEVALGDGRKLFARHFYNKADQYFHSGFYPSIYDSPITGEPHVTAAATPKGGEQTMDFLGEPKDWIDRFSRHFYPTRHHHLGDDDDHHEEEDHGTETASEQVPQNQRGVEKELLPWLRMSALMDPEQASSYLVAAFWLRTRLNKPQEAEQILRDGLRAIPRHPEILFELGRLHAVEYKNGARARNFWELALRSWREQEGGKPEPDLILQRQILANLARLEEDEYNFGKALEYLNELIAVSRHAEPIIKWHKELLDKRQQYQKILGDYIPVYPWPFLD